MLEHEVSKAKTTLAGDLTAAGRVVYWRVGSSWLPDTLNVVVARKCERLSKFDNWISLSTSYPGNAENKEDAASAVREVNKLARCLGK
jgi:hypothetical protein